MNCNRTTSTRTSSFQATFPWREMTSKKRDIDLWLETHRTYEQEIHANSTFVQSTTCNQQSSARRFERQFSIGEGLEHGGMCYY